MNYLAQRDFLEVEEANPRTAASARCDCNRCLGWDEVAAHHFRASSRPLDTQICNYNALSSYWYSAAFSPCCSLRKIRLEGGGLEAPRAIICLENTPILWGIKGQGEQPSKFTIYCPGELKLVLSKFNVLAPPARKSGIFLVWRAGTARWGLFNGPFCLIHICFQL